jgi:hypothetical protein
LIKFMLRQAQHERCLSFKLLNLFRARSLAYKMSKRLCFFRIERIRTNVEVALIAQSAFKAVPTLVYTPRGHVFGIYD